MTSSVFQGNFNFSSKLRELNVVGCSLTDKSFPVPSTSIQISPSSLRTLDLFSNQLKSSAIFHWLSNFTTNLHRLSLSENSLEGPIPDGFGKVMNSLEVLELGYNKLQGELPTSIGNIFTLQKLYLHNNNLQGKIPASLGNIRTLQGLYLQNNKLEGEIPTSLGNISTLQDLYLNNNNLSGEITTFIQNSSWCNKQVFHTMDLSFNRITGKLPSLSIFTSLRELYLSNNQITGDITELHLTNLKKLEVLDLTDNSILSLKVSTNWVPPFQLFSLGLASCKLGPTFPGWLHTQTRLDFLDISNAGIDDFVPEWFWNKLQFISKTNMSNNNLKGTIPNLPIKLTNAETFVILNSNQLEGGIPVFLSQVYQLDLSKNKITDFSTFLCGKNANTEMHTLDLSDNQIMGQLPDCWEHLNSLEFLDLSNNKLSGKIPHSIGTLFNLKALVLRNNSLIGDLPFTLKNCTGLALLDVSENLLYGPIPSWIGESLQNLKILSLRVNQFFGSVHVHLCSLSQIHVLDLSMNHLSGGIPTCLRNFTTMMEREVITRGRYTYRKLSSNVIYNQVYEPNVLLMWKGMEHIYWNPENLLKSIDISSNNLTGEIPKEVGYLLGLVSLNLSRNNLDGEIPYEIGQLNLLEFLDLSRNHFFGKIPSTLSKIDRLAMLDLSNNDLVGRIPWGRQLQNFDASSFEGNLGLCGEQLNKACPEDVTTTKPQGSTIHGEDNNSIFYEALHMSLGLGFFTGFWGLLGSIMLWKSWRNAYLKFLNKLTNYIFVMVEVNKTKFHRWFKG